MKCLLHVTKSLVREQELSLASFGVCRSCRDVNLRVIPIAHSSADYAGFFSTAKSPAYAQVSPVIMHAERRVRALVNLS